MTFNTMSVLEVQACATVGDPNQVSLSLEPEDLLIDAGTADK